MHKKVIQTLAVGVAGVTAISSSSFSVYAEDISVASTVTQSEESEQETAVYGQYLSGDIFGNSQM